MSIKTWPKHERPREKLLSRGAQHLSDAELLAIFLRTGTKGLSALDLARKLIQQFGSLKNILHADSEAFCRGQGLGLAKYAQLQANLEMHRRYLFEHIQHVDICKNSIQTRQYLQTKLGNRKQEIFACLLLDNQHHVLGFHELSTGSITSATVHPREIIATALQHRTTAIIFAHNHPSGNIQPSQQDIQMTQQLKTILLPLEIHVIDHIIVSHNATFSFAESGIL